MKGSVLLPVLITLVHELIPSHTANISKKKVNPENQELNFFLRIQKLNLSWEEILGSYKNVSAEAQTELCNGKCRTVMALWVLQHLKPCELIEKMDCPKGLVCCSFEEPEGEVKTSTPTVDPIDLKESDKEQFTSPFVSDIENETELFYPEPILDPIPDDESSEILKV